MYNFKLIISFGDKPNIVSLHVMGIEKKTGFEFVFKFHFCIGIVGLPVENGTLKWTWIKCQNLIVNSSFMCMKVSLSCCKRYWVSTATGNSVYSK